jgi:hypothetical protein
MEIVHVQAESEYATAVGKKKSCSSCDWEEAADLWRDK